MTGALLWTIAGCAEPEPEGNEPAAEPSPYVVDVPAGGGDAPTLAEVERALQDGLDAVVELDPRPVHQAYVNAMGDREGTCPYEYVTPDGNYWFDSCDTSGGASYDGYVFAYEAAGLPDPYNPGFVIDYWAAFGGAVVTDAEGHTLEVSGAITDYHVYGDAGGFVLDTWYFDLAGTFRWDGPEARGTWLETDYDPDLTMQLSVAQDLGIASVYLAGGYSGLPGGWAVGFDENFLGHADMGLPCEQEPTGTMSVRSPGGVWVDVRFDGELYPEDQVAAECDGCGTAFVDGEELGQVCVSLDTLLEKAVSQ